MTTIHAKAQDQVLVATILPKVACNNQKTVKLHVEFDAAWDGFAKSALFFTSNDPTVYPVPLTANGDCTVPAEVLADAGYLYITIQGANSASAAFKTTTPINYKVLPGTPSLVVSAPPSSVYQQLVNDSAVLKSRLSTLETGSTVEGSEVMGIRTDADGVKHDSAADAVIAQILSVRDGTVKENLIDMNRLSAGWLQTTGELTNSHMQANYYRWEYTSDFIPVIPGLPYTLSILYDRLLAGWCCVCTYDSEQAFISRMFVNEHTELEYVKKFTFADDVAYVRISYRSYMTAKVKFEQSSYATRIETDEPKNNLLDYRPFLFDGFIVESGSIFPQTEAGYAGEGIPALAEKYGRHIPVNAGEKYTIYQRAEKFPWCAVAVYDHEGKGIARYTSSENKFDITIPDGAIAMLICARSYYLTDLALFKAEQQMCADQWVRENGQSIAEAKENGGFDDFVKSINHRGFAEAPENTLSAFKLSYKKGFKYVECDVSFTSDNVAVLLHDGTIDRTSNGTGSINFMTFDDVRTLDFGSWKSEDYAGEQIPSFNEFIALCRNLGLHPYIELKAGKETQIKALVDVVKKHGMKGKVSWISFDSAYLNYIKAVDPAARLGFVVSDISESTINTVTESLRTGENEVFIDCAASNVTAGKVELCAAQDIPLEVWTVNNEDTIKALNVYVSGVTSDNLKAGSILAAANS